MIRWVVVVIGTARPRPTPATAVLMPTTRPELSASAPPELPGLSAASVWITSSITRTDVPARVGSDRPSALTTPAVTLPAKPTGLPTATTSGPNLLNAGERAAQALDPLRLMLGHQPHTPGQRLAARAGHAGVDERVEHLAVLEAQPGHHRHAQGGEELLHPAAAGAPGDLAPE